MCTPTFSFQSQADASDQAIHPGGDKGLADETLRFGGIDRPCARSCGGKGERIFERSAVNQALAYTEHQAILSGKISLGGKFGAADEGGRAGAKCE